MNQRWLLHGGAKATTAPMSTYQQDDNGDELRRATYYLRPDQIRALKLHAVGHGRPVSEVMREAVDRYLSHLPLPR